VQEGLRKPRRFGDFHHITLYQISEIEINQYSIVQNTIYLLDSVVTTIYNAVRNAMHLLTQSHNRLSHLSNPDF
jgi:hypothetical protein